MGYTTTGSRALWPPAPQNCKRFLAYDLTLLMPEVSAHKALVPMVAGRLIPITRADEAEQNRLLARQIEASKRDVLESPLWVFEAVLVVRQLRLLAPVPSGVPLDLLVGANRP